MFGENRGGRADKLSPKVQIMKAANLQGIIFIAGGCYCLFCYKKMARRAGDFYYNILRIRFSERGFRVTFVLAGFALIVFGLLLLSQII
jgi:TRAP-type C4-dicarboxylate transport system permease small subunit